LFLARLIPPNISSLPTIHKIFTPNLQLRLRGRASAGDVVGDRQRKKLLARRVEADSFLPPLREHDNVSINFRKILIEREELGLPRPSPRALKAIGEQGYDAFFVNQMNSYTKIGLALFHKLAAMQRVELTTEYIVFHHYREQIKSDCRRRIAILLLNKSQKPR
jgi:hypothetical protein